MITVFPHIRPSLEYNPGRVLIMPTVEGAPYKKKIPALNISPQAIFEVLTITLCKYKYVHNYLHSSYRIFCFSRFLEFTLGAKCKIPHSFDVILLKSRKLL